MARARKKLRVRRIVSGFLAAAFAVIASVSPAAAAELVVPLSEPEASVESTEMPVEYRVATALVTLGGSDLAPVAIESPVDDVGPLPDGTGALLGQSCKQYWVRIDYKNSRGDTIMYYKQTKDWCWSNSTHKLTSVGVVASGHVYAWADPVWNYDGTIGSTNYYYNSGRSHYSFREGKFSAHCGPWSCGNKTPEIIIRAHGGGTQSYWTRG